MEIESDSDLKAFLVSSQTVSLRTAAALLLRMLLVAAIGYLVCMGALHLDMRRTGTIVFVPLLVFVIVGRLLSDLNPTLGEAETSPRLQQMQYKLLALAVAILMIAAIVAIVSAPVFFAIGLRAVAFDWAIFGIATFLVVFILAGIVAVIAGVVTRQLSLPGISLRRGFALTVLAIALTRICTVPSGNFRRTSPHSLIG